MENEDDRFTREVHEVVHKLNDWMRQENPDAARLMPALAVVLGRVAARTASDQLGLEGLLVRANRVTVNAAMEDWHGQEEEKPEEHTVQ